MGDAEYMAIRSRCTYCKRPLKVCYCHLCREIDNKTPVLLLQHPDETKKALNTARIIALNLTRSAIWQGVDFSFENITQWFDAAHADSWTLLYPGSAAQPLTHFKQTYPVDKQVGILLLDGTWRNAREIYLRNSWMHSVMQVGIEVHEKSRYRIRKAPKEGCLSTVEAVCQALDCLEPELSTETMNACFEYLIDTQIRCMGEEVYRRHYDRP